VTLADGLQVHAGETLRKVWSIKNVGTAPWPVGTKLIFVGGDLAAESEGRWGCDAQGALVPYAGPGDIVHVSMDIVVPEEAGRFRATFRLQTLEGARFGPRVWIDLNVPEQKPAEADKTAAAPASAAAAAPQAAKPEVKADAPAYAASAFASAASAAAPKPAAVSLPVASPVAAPVKVQQVQQVQQVAAPVAAVPEQKPVAAPVAAAPVASAPAAAPVASAPAASAAAAPAAAAPVAPVAPARPPFAYAGELEYLHSMGFADSALNKYLLLNNKGNLQAVVQWLLSNAKSA